MRRDIHKTLAVLEALAVLIGPLRDRVRWRHVFSASVRQSADLVLCDDMSEMEGKTRLYEFEYQYSTSWCIV